MFENKTIRIALVGAGCMGAGLFQKMERHRRMRCDVLAEIRIERAIACAQQAGRPYRIVKSRSAMRDAIRDGFLALCEDGMLAALCEEIDVFVDASNAIGASGSMCERALLENKHVVMMNSEADLIFGPYFLELSREKGVVYTSCDGDQHGVLARIIDETSSWGFELVLAGNIKGYLDRDSNPTAIIPEADKRNLDYKMATAYTDGTKLSIEMALLANAYGLRATQPGMRGPVAKDVHEALDRFDLEAIWRSGQPVVDYLLGANPSGGVFVIGRSEDPYERRMMEYYKMGKGPFYVFYRPYHLCHVESMRCIEEAFFFRKSLLQPLRGFQTNVFAYAKRDLQEGEILDGIGGYACYGMIENQAEQKKDPLPICLAEDVALKRRVKKDEKIFLSDVHVPEHRTDFQLYRKAMPQCLLT